MKKISIFLNIILILMVFGNVQGQVAVSDSVELRDTIKFIRPFDLNSGRLDKKSLTAWSCRTTYEVIGDTINIIFETNISYCGIYTLNFYLPMAVIELHDNKKLNAKAAEGNFSISGEILNLCYFDTTAINGYQDLLLGVFYINLDDRRVGFYLVEAFPIEGVGQGKVCPDGRIIYQGGDLNSVKPVVETLNDYSYLISWNLYWGGKAKIQVDIDSLNQFSLMAVSDTINHSGTTTIKVRAIDSDNNNVDIPEETLLNFSLDENGAKFGSLIAPDGSVAKSLTGITYGDAKAGKVKYIADGEEPDGPKQIVITVVKSDDASINGSGNVVVIGYNLKIVNPETGESNKYITSEPEMPQVTCQAKVDYYEGVSIPINWQYQVSYQLPTREGSHTFTGMTQFTGSGPTTWNVSFDRFIGGDVNVSASTEIDSKTYSDSVISIYEILGENPTPEQARDGVGLELQVIMYKESRFRQFNSSGYPLYGPPNGYGICQIDNPAATENELWNWQANRSRGITVFDGKRDWGLGYPERLRNKARRGELALCYSNVTDFTTDEQILKEAFQLYNGGHQWVWQPFNIKNANSGGQWLPRPGRTGYGDDAWETYQNPPWN